MIRKNKRGMELSINFIVMLVMGMAVFGGGLAFSTKFFTHAESVRGSLDSQTEKQIEKLLDSGSPVAIPISQKEIKRNKFDTFGIGVMAQFNGEYIMNVQPNGAFRRDKTAITVNTADWLNIPMTKLELEKNDKGKYLVGVTVPKAAERGTYMFKVVVSYRDPNDASNNLAEYDNPIQFFVTVP
ncbi:MAG: hypothetical protein V1729_06605 [Candidatus Woesearchaeota archaeon]